MLHWITSVVGLVLVTFGLTTVFSLLLLLCGVNRSPEVGSQATVPSIAVVKNVGADVERDDDEAN